MGDNTRRKRCDDCRLAKTPMIYLRSSRKLCSTCWQLDKQNKKSLINSMMLVVPWDAPLGYKFVNNEWFLDEAKGKRMTDWVYEYMTTAVS